MSAIKLRENIWSVGVLNPTLRVFDIVMESKYGTSYNAYLLTGEKNVLIETVHVDYFDEYLDNIRQVIPLEDVDYLIMNHNEPDHSGSVAKLLTVCPKLEIIATKAGKKHLQDITNLDLPCRAVGAGDTLDLGNRVLEFIPAPMLHWADSMFTWDSARKTLFTCDFLGAHFCEPTMLDSKIHVKEAYEGEFAYYYEGIFGPFRASVLSGLDKMPADVELVCPSHGPCLTETIARAKELYRTWSTPAPKTQRTAFVVYASAYGCTRALADAAAQALEGEGYAVTTADVTVMPYAECVKLAHEADVLMVGSPTINRVAPKAVWDVLTSIDPINLKGKAAGAFGAYGWSGEAAPMLHTFLKGLRYAAPEAPFRVLFTPTQADLDAMADYARSVAALCTVPVDAPAGKTDGGKWVCALCGYIYDPAEGDPAHGVAPGTPWEQVPSTWSCPLCGVDKDMFKKVD
nr:rubredoxin [uncultured Flavonifractor sp.]